MTTAARFFAAAFAAAALLALPLPAPAQNADIVVRGPGPYSSGNCTSSFPNPPSDFINYTLTLTFPTTGYTLSLLGTTLNHSTVNIRVRYTLAPGPVGDIVTYHSVKFSQIAPRFPAFFIVTANGKLLGPPKKITLVSTPVTPG
ncbi:MAG: hypothetical protein ABSH19_03365 [Opitutales bacterium]